MERALLLAAHEDLPSHRRAAHFLSEAMRIHGTDGKAPLAVQRGQCLKIGHIAALETTKELRRRGHATTMLRECVTYMRYEQFDLVIGECLPDVAPLYEKCGATPVSHRLQFAPVRTIIPADC